MIQWDEEKGLLVDEMGLPVPLSVARQWRECIDHYCAQSPMFIFGHYVSMVRKRFPEFEGQFNKTEEDFE
jgi:hypothetical protein